MKAAIDAESLADALAGQRRCCGGALKRYNERAPALRRLAGRARPPHRLLFRRRDGDPRQRVETPDARIRRRRGSQPGDRGAILMKSGRSGRNPLSSTYLPRLHGIVAAPMSRLPITIATWDYDRVRPLVDGRVQVEGCDVNYLTMPVEECFERAYFHGEFEVAEIGFSPYLIALSRGAPPYVAVPAFLSRMFRHSAVYIRTDRGIDGPRRSARQAHRRAGISDVGGDVVSRLSAGRVRHRREGHQLGAGRPGESRPPRQISAQSAARFSADARATTASRCRRCWPTARSTR